MLDSEIDNLPIKPVMVNTLHRPRLERVGDQFVQEQKGHRRIGLYQPLGETAGAGHAGSGR